MILSIVFINQLAETSSITILSSGTSQFACAFNFTRPFSPVIDSVLTIQSLSNGPIIQFLSLCFTHCSITIRIIFSHILILGFPIGKFIFYPLIQISIVDLAIFSNQRTTSSKSTESTKTISIVFERNIRSFISLNRMSQSGTKESNTS